MSKKINDLILEPDIKREKYINDITIPPTILSSFSSSLHNHINERKKVSLSIFPVVKIGSSIWGYSCCSKTYLQGVVLQKNEDAKSMEIECLNYPFGGQLIKRAFWTSLFAYYKMF